jgi:hypothetical protein
MRNMRLALIFGLLITAYVQASQYNCEKMVTLSQECFNCQQKKNCTSYHNLNCPKIDSYKKKCADYLSTQVGQADGATSQPTDNPEKKTNQKNEPYPIINNKGLKGNDLHAVTPDQPIPAPGMNNTQPNPSKNLSSPPSNFIMRSWY